MTPGDLAVQSLLGAAIVLTAIMAAQGAHRFGVPALLVFLAIGLALGESGVGIHFSDAGLAEVLGLGALVLILAEGGLTTNWSHTRPAIGAAFLLATAGVAISTVIVGAFAHWALGMSWRNGLLLGAVLAPTDAAAVFSVLRRLPLTALLDGVLEGEAGLNDAATVLAVTLLAGTHGPGTSALAIAGKVIWQLAGGLVIGLAVGTVGVYGLRRAALPASGLYPVAVVALIVAGYGAATLSAASGFLAVYVSAIMLGNAQMPHRPATRGFAEGAGWLSQIGLFVMLGLLDSPRRLPGALGPAIAVGLVAVLIARPAAVWGSLAPLRWLPARHFGPQLRIQSVFAGLRLTRGRPAVRPAAQPPRAGPRKLAARLAHVARQAPPTRLRLSWQQQAFLSWAGLRGAVPIVLATIPLTERVPGAASLFDIVFVVVIVTTIVQGPSLPWAARRLDVARPAEPLEITVEAAPLEELHADLLQAAVPEGSQLHGVSVHDLRMPAAASLALIVRDGAGTVPGPSMLLRSGDQLLIVCPAAVRGQVERRLRAVSRAGKLARWAGETGD